MFHSVATKQTCLSTDQLRPVIVLIKDVTETGVIAMQHGHSHSTVTSKDSYKTGLYTNYGVAK